MRGKSILRYLLKENLGHGRSWHQSPRKREGFNASLNVLLIEKVSAAVGLSKTRNDAMNSDRKKFN